MRNVPILFMSMLFLSAKAQVKNPFLQLKYDKVVFYDFDYVGDKASFILDRNGTPLQKIIKQVALNNNTIKKLNVKLGSKKSYGQAGAACFEPHCGVVYFLKGKTVAQISICVACNRLYSSIDIPAQKQGKEGKGKEAYYMLDGLSDSFRKFIGQLLKINNFTHQLS